MRPSAARVVARYLTASSPDGRVDKAKLNSFMSDYYRMTAPHPFDRGSRVWADPDDVLIFTEMRPFDGYIRFGSIASPEKPGKGYASKVIKAIVELADKHGVAMTLTAKPFGNMPNTLSRSDLMGWYHRYGWVKDPKRSDGDMIRFPS